MDANLKLRKLMNERGWTTYRLAKESGLAEATIGNLFRRNTQPTLPTLELICKGLGITLSQFFAEDELIEVTPELKELFDEWIFLTPEQKEAVHSTIKAMKHD